MPLRHGSPSRIHTRTHTQATFDCADFPCIGAADCPELTLLPDAAGFLCLAFPNGSFAHGIWESLILTLVVAPLITLMRTIYALSGGSGWSGLSFLVFFDPSL